MISKRANTLISILTLLTIVFIFWKLKSLWLPILTIVFTIGILLVSALIITYVLNPPVKYLIKLGLKRSLAAGTVYLIATLFLAVSLFFLLPKLIDQVSDLINNLPILINHYDRFIMSLNEKFQNYPKQVQAQIYKFQVLIEESIQAFFEKTVQSTGKLLESLLVISLAPFVSFYALKDYPHFRGQFEKVIPRGLLEKLRNFIFDVNGSLSAYLRGQIILSLIVGVFATVVLFIFRLDYAFLLGVFIGLTNIIPYFGPVLGALPAVLVASALSLKKVLLVIILIFAIQFIESGFLSPIIVGKSSQLHPITVIIALLIGGQLAGILGLIVAIPVTAIIKISFIHYFAHFKN